MPPCSNTYFRVFACIRLNGEVWLVLPGNHNFKFQNHLKIILDVDNILLYQHVKYQIQIFHMLGYTKITESNRFEGVAISQCTLTTGMGLCADGRLLRRRQFAGAVGVAS